MAEINGVVVDRTNYTATKEHLKRVWGWEEIDALPNVEFQELIAGNYPASKLLHTCVFNGCIILRGSDNKFYSAFTLDIPFGDDWRIHDYEGFGVFTDTDKIANDIFR